MATSDVATTVISSNVTRNGSATVFVSVVDGTAQRLHADLNIQVNHSGLESKYGDRFDNTGYYT
jgi:hypothetical protein